MEKIKELWKRINYETFIFGIFTFQFLTGRALDMNSWATAWSAMDYTMGTGSRLLIGSIYRLFLQGEYLDLTVAYKYTAVGTELTILVAAIVLGRLLRKSLKEEPKCKAVILGAGIVYLAAPFSVAYTWNEANLGRLDVYMLMTALLAIYAALEIKNLYLRISLITMLSIIGLAIHQGFAFLYYPIIIAVFCYDVFKGTYIDGKAFVGVGASGIITAGVAVWFQFFSSINFTTLDELVQAVKARTNMDISEWALEIEYFGGLRYQIEKITPEFFKYEHPWIRAGFVLLLLLPILIVYAILWKDVFGYLRENKIRVWKTPYPFVLLANLLFVPMFLIHTDWGRHFAPFFAMQLFVFLFYMAKGEAAVIYAFQKMQGHVVRSPYIFVLLAVWLSMLESFEARNPFQSQAESLFQFFSYGFYI